MNPDDLSEEESWAARFAQAQRAESAWPFVDTVVDWLAAHWRLVARLYGYGVGLVCVSVHQGPRGMPIGCAICAFTVLSTNHEGLIPRGWQARWLRTRPQRLRAYAILAAIVLLSLLVLPPARQ